MTADNATVLVVDDDASICDSLSNLVRSAALHVQTFASAQEFLGRRRRAGPSCLVLDVDLPGLNGLDLQQKLLKGDVRIPIIFITGHGDIPMTVRAMKAGAIEFLTKPCRDEDLLDAIAQGIHHHREQLGERRRAEETARSEGECRSDTRVSKIVWHGEAMRRDLQAVDTVAPTDSTVLIRGETGTGKELIARAICSRGRRRHFAAGWHVEPHRRKETLCKRQLCRIREPRIERWESRSWMADSVPHSSAIPSGRATRLASR
jgi:DNA-binding NtrC family response regulator